MLLLLPPPHSPEVLPFGAVENEDENGEEEEEAPQQGRSMEGLVASDRKAAEHQLSLRRETRASMGQQLPTSVQGPGCNCCAEIHFAVERGSNGSPALLSPSFSLSLLCFAFAFSFSFSLAALSFSFSCPCFSLRSLSLSASLSLSLSLSRSLSLSLSLADFWDFPPSKLLAPKVSAPTLAPAPAMAAIEAVLVTMLLVLPP
mmetsp:Transcript_31359/g.66599  ORF Transcript_31359/g.66599 Transcript_31359/m.66599 type:complete len:202 (-) Transcript_31359:204-809(-)